jgi:hypothetical protein
MTTLTTEQIISMTEMEMFDHSERSLIKQGVGCYNEANNCLYARIAENNVEHRCALGWLIPSDLEDLQDVLDVQGDLSKMEEFLLLKVSGHVNENRTKFGEFLKVNDKFLSAVQGIHDQRMTPALRESKPESYGMKIWQEALHRFKDDHFSPDAPNIAD